MIRFYKTAEDIIVDQFISDIMDFTLLGFILYLTLMLVFGLATYRKNKSHEDYFLGSRKLNPLLVAFSERTSGESAWLLLGLPGAALSVGFAEGWTVLGCVGGIIFSWFVIAKDLRIQTEKYDSITLPNFIASKFSRSADDKYSSAIRILSILIIIFFFTFYLAAQFLAAGKVLFATFGIPAGIGMIIGASIIILYTMMGGFLAVVWTDLVQGLIMIIALIVLPIVGLIELNDQGLSLAAALESAGDGFMSLSGGKTGWAAAALIVGGLSWGLGYMGQPHLVTKFMAIRTPGEIKQGRRIAIAWAIPAFFGAMMIGIIGLAIYGRGEFSDIEHVMPFMATQLLPAWIAGIIISGAIAAMMSTADSQLLVISSSIIEDFYHKTLKRNVNEKGLLKMSRAITLLVGLIGFLMAYSSEKYIYTLVSYAWAGLGSSFGPALLLILKWKKVTAAGVLAGMITGTISTVIWITFDELDAFISVRFISFVLAFLAIIVVSLWGRGKGPA